MNKINIKGKDYVTVAERLLHIAANEVHEIETEPIFYENAQMWVVKATLTLHREGGKFKFTGHAQEIIGDGYINKTSALENAETSAVGRACAMAGIGIIESIASVDEINKANARETYKPKPDQNFAAMTPKKPLLPDSRFNKALMLYKDGDSSVYTTLISNFELTKDQLIEWDKEVNKWNAETKTVINK